MPGLIGFTVAGSDSAAMSTASAMMRRMTHRPEQQSRVTCLGRAYLGRVGTEMELENGWPGESESSGATFGVFQGVVTSYGSYGRMDFMERIKSDVDRILHLYDSGETEFYKELEGAFSFALWDGKNDEFLVGMDPYGQAPLYYIENATDGCVAFASEMKCLLALPYLAPEVDPMAPLEHMAFGHLLGDRTWLRHVRVVPPGSVMRFGSGSAVVQRHREYDFTDQTLDGTREDTIEELSRRLAKAIETTTVGADKIHIFCGGGINARALLGFGAAQENARTEAHTFGLEGAEDFLSGEVAASLARTPWKGRIVDPHLLWKNAQPTVYLSDGELGMEAAGIALLARRIGDVKDAALFGGGGGLAFGVLPDHCIQPGMVDSKYYQEFWERHSEPLRTIAFSECFQEDLVREMPLDDLPDYIESHHKDCPSRETWQAALFFRLHHRRRRRGCAVETLAGRFVRSVNPFFASSLAEFGFRLPLELRQDGALLSAAIRGVSPKLALLRDSPNPWRVDATASRLMSRQRRPTLFDKWFRKELRPDISVLFESEREAIAAVFDPDYVEAALVDHWLGRSNNAQFLLTVIQTVMVVRSFISVPDSGVAPLTDE